MALSAASIAKRVIGTVLRMLITPVLFGQDSTLLAPRPRGE
jgi:hypothetical protein